MGTGEREEPKSLIRKNVVKGSVSLQTNHFKQKLKEVMFGE